jgi:hypothetical protein
MDKWEYNLVSGPERDIYKLMNELNENGSEGWEAFASVGMRKGISSDTLTVLLKRPTKP